MRLLTVASVLLLGIIGASSAAAAHAHSDPVVVDQHEVVTWVPDRWVDTGCGPQLVPGHYERRAANHPVVVERRPRVEIVIGGSGHGHHQDRHAQPRAHVAPQGHGHHRGDQGHQSRRHHGHQRNGH